MFFVLKLENLLVKLLETSLNVMIVVALYGSTTVSDTFGEGITLNVFIIRSGYSSRIFDISNVPIPEPVPPPNECAN
ncbi:Tubulin [Dermatophagoides pteronyssinus]|uniref:Tubulin n=1 Tax=Dermatophagoides pteronyssinus TaxID=6956 RepID=A0ABQ8JV92_DERPT|nr:Tubulin [Dermatophagoides pteronyssinus]